METRGSDFGEPPSPDLWYMDMASQCENLTTPESSLVKCCGAYIKIIAIVIRETKHTFFIHVEKLPLLSLIDLFVPQKFQHNDPPLDFKTQQALLTRNKETWKHFKGARGLSWARREGEASRRTYHRKPSPCRGASGCLRWASIQVTALQRLVPSYHPSVRNKV
ncbi:hypothetical protein E2C01_014613 [Portunus trituberculatus]|uniref:Uncharacterized protein n=1 Tax=Portunus trituberculatus TaxID=210409 RepID=A0A5B7DKT5_PORTR|nr:hypothetical protein [Portunus trituberculatus]